MGSIVAPDGSDLIAANFLVNLNGERFVGEGEPKYVLQRAVSQQPEKAAFLITDANYARYGHHRQEDRAGLCEAVRTPSRRWLRTTASTPSSCKRPSTPTTRLPMRANPFPPWSMSWPPTRPPRWKPRPSTSRRPRCVPLAPSPASRSNDSCQVLDGEGQVVEGLYASGELIAGNAFTRQYPRRGHRRILRRQQRPFRG